MRPPWRSDLTTLAAPAGSPALLRSDGRNLLGRGRALARRAVWSMPVGAGAGSAGIYTLLVVAVGTLFALESVGREYLAAAPAFAVIGILGPGRQHEGWRMLSMGAPLVLLAAFLTGRFVG